MTSAVVVNVFFFFFWQELNVWGTAEFGEVYYGLLWVSKGFIGFDEFYCGLVNVS